MFNIARQPLVPAFILLVALIVAAMWRVVIPGAESVPMIPAAVSGLVLMTPESFLVDFQTAFPLWSRWIGGFLLLLTGMSVGRIGVRYNLYSVNTCVQISLFGILMIGFVRWGAFLPDLVALTLFALSIKNFCRGFSSTFGFDGLFRGALYLGAIPFFEPAALPMLLLLLLVIVVFRRTFRELSVALAGLLLPSFVICYLNWAFGGAFPAPVGAMMQDLDPNRFFEFFTSQSLPQLVLLGIIVCLGLLGMCFFLADMYAVGNKPRHILALVCCTLFLCIGTLCMPSADGGLASLTAIPVAILLPAMFVRVHRPLASGFYLLLLAASVSNLFLQ